ncbi:MAG: T9SS type A sorting domain-containing protein [Chitinophagales bacterium]|nr:T9SS type A sorting domain-containing protein [Chitinophagales bacterium]
MRRYLLFGILLGLFLVETSAQQNTFWERIPSPLGGGNRIVHVGGDTLYSLRATLQETYRSTDGGNTWSPLAYQMPPNANPDELALQTSLKGNFIIKTLSEVDYSEDGGQSWQTSPLPPGNAEIYETRTGVWLCWAQPGKVYRSTDKGLTWLPVLLDPLAELGQVMYFQDKNIVTLFRDDNIFGGVLMYRKFWHSSDDGATWTPILIPHAITQSTQFFTHSQAFVAPNQKVYLSIGVRLYRGVAGDSSSFVQLPNLPTTSFNGFTTLASGRLFCIDLTRGIYASDNEGNTWTQLSAERGGYFIPLPTVSPEALYISSKNAFYRSLDGGNTWNFASQGIQQGNVYALCELQNGHLLAQTQHGLCRSADNGQNWEKISDNTASTTADYNLAQMRPDGRILIRQSNTQLLWSADGGQTFTPVPAPPGMTNTGLAAPTYSFNPYDNAIYVLGSAGIYRTKTLGQNWTLWLPNQKYLPLFLPTGRIISAFTNPTALQYSDDEGLTWTNANFSIPSGDISLLGDVLWASPTGEIYLYLQNNGGKLWRSDDQGVNWATLPNLPSTWPRDKPLALHITPQGHVYAPDQDRKPLLSISKGEDWQILPSPLPELDFLPSFSQISLGASGRLYYAYYAAIFKTSTPVTEGAYLEGRVYVDGDGDCLTTDTAYSLKRMVLADGANADFYTRSKADGRYTMYLPQGSYEVSAANPNVLWWEACDSVQSVELNSIFERDTADFAFNALTDCPLMTVNIALPFLRRCFTQTAYINYCNEGTSAADSAYLDLLLDPVLSITGASLPYSNVGNHLYRFQLGNVGVETCGQIQVSLYTACGDSTVLGQTHCITAKVYPDSVCVPVPNWSGTTLEAHAICQDSVLVFELHNTGPVGTAPLEYIVIEDDVVLMQGNPSYAPNEVRTIEVPANGHTWRLESEQVPNHPFSFKVIAFAEGCGGYESLGYINDFSVNGIEPHTHTVCVRNIGAYDPNDKQGFPEGNGAAHRIDPGQRIDYLIRFQNTGTDTAFTVVIRDTLSPLLNPMRLREGPASHPMQWSVDGQGVLTFRFDNILLPDSSTNLAASQGFVQFSIEPFDDIPLGSVIHNEAAIYFDFNAPITTNQTWHTIDTLARTVSVNDGKSAAKARLLASPNPFAGQTLLRLETETKGPYLWQILDINGREMQQVNTASSSLFLDATSWSSGIYYVKITDKSGQIIGTGRLLNQPVRH